MDMKPSTEMSQTLSFSMLTPVQPCRKDRIVVVQGSAEVPAFSELFYTQFGVNDTVKLKGMIDLGSMACTLNEEAECSLKEAGVLVGEPQSAERIVLVGLVPGQRNELIIGSNVLKHLMRVMKGSDDYWKLVSTGCKHSILDYEHFLDMMSCTTRWRGDKVPDKISTVKLSRAVTLLPQREHLVWGKLPSNVPVSPGSTIIVEPCTSKSRPRDILVGRVITPMWGDRWVPMKVTNLSSKSITLKRNSTVSPCLAVEDLDIQQGSCKMENRAPDRVDRPAASDADLKDRLSNLGTSLPNTQQAHTARLRSKLPCYTIATGRQTLRIGLFSLAIISNSCNRLGRIPYLHLPCVSWRITSIRILPSRKSCHTLESQSLVSPSDAGDLSVCGETDNFSSLGEESSQARTSLWVLSDTGHTVRDTVAEELVSQLTNDTDTHCDTGDKMDNAHVAPDLPDSERVAAPTETTAPVDSGETQTNNALTQTTALADSEESGRLFLSLALPHSSGHRLNLPRHDSDQVTVRGKVVTRAGRVVNSVNRRIENMVQKPIKWGLVSPQKALSVV
ncbi:hypothetical protein N1851_002790 [Merluccius polli]|uniref:Uncharacterized protein n=1 Tax=Merluccius polli TaxID=89951 RepID=A0AA47N9H1_MERPO|nr:hypothetical protein N1851_002790 [Merluccius polli]